MPRKEATYRMYVRNIVAHEYYYGKRRGDNTFFL
jgi:hypothetical protein